MPDKIILVDANSLVHRAYHALPNLKSSKGMYTGAIYGFLSILLKLIKEQNPTHVAAAFDLRGPTFRHNMFEGYKSTRKPMDDELARQIEPLKELLSDMGIRCISKPGYEADDILGTLAKRFGGETIILTGDRDSFQLISDSTKIFWTKKGVSDVEVYDVKRLAEDGFTAGSFIDYKALRGDPSDNIPGVAGVGEKTAKLLLDQYKTLDEVLIHANEIKGKIGESIAANKDIALLSRTLATIDTEVPIECELEDITFDPVFSPRVRAKLGELEMTSLASRMTFSGEIAQRTEKTVVTLDSSEGIEKAEMSDNVAVAVGDKICFSSDGKIEYLIECAEDLFGGITFDEALEIIKNRLRGREIICFDYKKLSKQYGISGRFFDVMIAAHLTRGSAPIKSPAVLGEGLESSAADLFEYADRLRLQIEEQGLHNLFYDVEQPLAEVLGKMEDRGFSVDKTKLETLQSKYAKILESLSEEIFSYAGVKFNISSPKQLGEVLFDRLGLRHGKKTKTGFSVGEDVLSSLSEEHPIIDAVLKWRHFSKLLNTYVIGLQPLIVRGKIHTEFNQCITATGRLSSTNPNLQNIPVRGNEARDVKSAFIASEGNVLVSADYSQIELRLLAHLSGDENLIDAYRRADDIHAMTASQILGIPIEDVTPELRREAKAVNFGIIYGISDFGLAENLSIPKYRAKEFIDRYFERYPKVREYLESTKAFARENGFAVTMLGRRRNLQEINSGNYLTRSAAERMAMNTPLQGTAADIVKLAMLAVEKRLENMKSKMILQVHDELIVDAAADEAENVKSILTEEMENAVSLRVPLIAEACSAGNWGDLK